MKRTIFPLFITLLFLFTLSCEQAGKETSRHAFNSYYTGRNLDRIAFPVGGIGAGMFCLEGTGAISHLSVTNHPEIFNEPFAFAAISIKGQKNGAKVLEAPVPSWKIFGQPGTGNGLGEKNYGYPRFESGKFLARFPFALVELEDKDIPLEVAITGWSPFIPADEDNSSLPAGALEYRFKNNTGKKVEAVFSYNARNIIDNRGQIRKSPNGFRMTAPGNGRNGDDGHGFTIFVNSNEAVTDHCWFRGGWFDTKTILWKNIEAGKIVSNPPTDAPAPGASIYVPVELEPGEEKTIAVNFCWYLPETNMALGRRVSTGPAFRQTPSGGTAPNQKDVTGFAGKQLVNTYDPAGDGQTGTLESEPFLLNRRYLKFLVGGGNNVKSTAVQLLVGGQVVNAAAGNNTEMLSEKTWDLSEYAGKKAVLKIVDQSKDGWGHILADQFVLTDKTNEELQNLSPGAILIEDFEGKDYGGWQITPEPGSEKACCAESSCSDDPYYTPWYAARFNGVEEVANYWRRHYTELREKSSRFREAFYSTTLPDEVKEAVAANLTILKSPTVLRQTDGRLWCFEGCSDNTGCCHGSCTHVWNYAQAIPHLFPALERTLRETEFRVNQNQEGHQVFRANLPISQPLHLFHAAADGQLGGIMKTYREWRISGDTGWMEELYPLVKQSLDYCIETWDPEHQGYPAEPQHNTYDIEFWGPNGMITSFYLGALTAFVEMSNALDQPCDLYKNLLEKGKEYMEGELFNGEYYIQKIQWTGLNAPDPVEARSMQTGYTPEALEILKKEGPKYQYGNGCLSDGVLGMWIAAVCGLEQTLDKEQIKSHLSSVHQYNLKKDLLDHSNPQRPTFACGKEGGLLLCSWPKGGKLSLPFVYSNEVWTGIEYQVASHLMMSGEVEKGLEIVRECRKRYDGTIRNPFNEYECGHWYARALASYGLLQGLTGVRYDAIDRTLFIDSRIGDFTSFISTATGFGNVGLKNGKPFIDVAFGTIDVRKVMVSGEEKTL